MPNSFLFMIFTCFMVSQAPVYRLIVLTLRDDSSRASKSRYG